MAFSIETSPFVSVADTERLWRELEPRANPSFFLSWTWIGTWLETSAVAPEVVTARSNGRLIGIGLVNAARRHRIGMTWPTLSLNESGHHRHDCIMIEDNGFLAERGLEHEVTKACLLHIVDAMPDWRELRLGGVPDLIAHIVRELRLTIQLEAERASPFTDLSAVTEDGEPSSLSRNARQQLRRSLRLYRAVGPLDLVPSPDKEEAMARFAELEKLHQRRWKAKGKPGAFAQPFFRHFHQALLARGFPRGEVDILRITAGNRTIGLLYSFFHNNDAYSYQSGFNYEADARLKPGLVSHLLALAHCRRRGMACYRFLAGDSRYKRTLSTSAYPLHWLTLRRSHFAFRVEKFARRLAGRDA